MTAIKTLVDMLKRRAGDMARPFIDAAQHPAASDSERAFGEAARLILKDAEARAQQLPRKEFEQRVKALKDWHRRHEATLRREIARLIDDASRTGSQARILEVRRRATAELDHREAEFHDWVESHALAAWIRATEHLLTLDRPSAFISTQASPSRH